MEALNRDVPEAEGARLDEGRGIDPGDDARLRVGPKVDGAIEVRARIYIVLGLIQRERPND